MSHHHHGHHEHRHHVRTPEGPKSDNSLFWLLMIFLAAVMGLGFWLSRPPLPPHTDAANHSCMLSERGLECGKEMSPAPTADATPEPGIEPEPVAEPAVETPPITTPAVEPIRHAHHRPQHHFPHHAKPEPRHKPRAEPRHHIRHHNPAPRHHAEAPAYTPPDNTPSWDDPSKYSYIPGEMRE